MKITKETIKQLIGEDHVPEAIKRSCFEFNVELQKKIQEVAQFIEEHELEMHVSGTTVLLVQSHFGAVNPDNLHPDSPKDGGTLDSCVIAGELDAVIALSNIVISQKYEQENEE